MKIKRKENDDLVKFSSLSMGDVFEYEGNLCVKCNYVIDRQNDETYNCLTLDDGFLFCVDDKDLVKPYPNAKLVLED